MTELYKDKFCALDSSGLSIFLYYFPYGDKHLRLDHIKRVDRFLSPAYRIWGSGDLKHWWSCDASRLGTAKAPSVYVMVEASGEGTVKCFTVEDGEGFFEVLGRLKPEAVVGTKKVEGFSIVTE